MAYKKLKFWFDKELAVMLSEKIIQRYPAFDRAVFVAAVDKGTRHLELKPRVEWIADELKKQLPENFIDALDILIDVLGPENDQETGMFSEY